LGLKRTNTHPETKHRWLKPLLAILIAAMALGAYQLYATVSEVGLTGLLPASSSAGKHIVQLAEQPVYQVKKKQELLGVNVVRIISKRQPEEFLVLDGVSRKLVDSIYAKPVDLPWANTVANQFLRLRETGEDASPVSVEIQEVKTIQKDVLKLDGRELPYWRLQVRFKLSNESEPRYYEAIVARNARGETEPSASDALVVAYAQREAFQQELLADLIKNLHFERN
jgi:hypothetical protein